MRSENSESLLFGTLSPTYTFRIRSAFLGTRVPSKMNDDSVPVRCALDLTANSSSDHTKAWQYLGIVLETFRL